MEKFSFCLPYQLSMSLAVKTVPEITQDFITWKTVAQGTECTPPPSLWRRWVQHMDWYLESKPEISNFI